MNKKLRKGSAVLLLLPLVLVLISGCSALPFVGGTPTVQMRIAGQSDMNSGGNGAVVRVYQLSGEINFKRTPLSTFWRNDQEALGGELVRQKEVLLYPDETKTFELEVAETASHIGIAANLRDPDQEQWRAIYPVGALEDGTTTATVLANRIEVDR
jgi:type VI secretion system VasD/TssJ family lipoprotein